MLTQTEYKYIMVDENGKAVIEGHPRMPVRILVGHSLTNGWSPEELKWQFPQLTMAQVYAALAYYHDHQADMNVQNEADAEDSEFTRKHPSRQELERRRSQTSG